MSIKTAEKLPTYDFSAQLAQGETGERKLDAYFSRWFSIRPAKRAEQRRGIDRFFSRQGATYPVEYKTDARADETGNAFVETVSVDTVGKQGWAYTSEAEFLLYYVPGAEAVYIIPFTNLRQHLAQWVQSYPLRKIPNKGYCTHGILVPLTEFERIAQRVESL